MVTRSAPPEPLPRSGPKGPGTAVRVRAEPASPSADEQLTVLNRLYRNTAAENDMLAVQVEWLKKAVNALNAKRRWWWWFVPGWLLRSALFRRLKRREIFDEASYKLANPDVAKAGLDPLRHYVFEGMQEGRSGIFGDQRAMVVRRAVAGNREKFALDEALRHRILDSGLFDAAWYRDQYAGSIRDGQNPLEDYLTMIDDDVFRDPGALFSTSHYLEVNRDVRSMHPLVHFVEYGLFEGRRAFSPAKVNAFLAGGSIDGLRPLASFLDPALPTVVLYWKGGNFFFTDIAHYVVSYLENKGFIASSLDSDTNISAGGVNIVVVAPHEYCVHGPGQYWSSDRFSDAVYINTEQWHTSWFTLAYNVFRRSGKVLDINPASAAGFARLGMQAGFLPLLPLPGSRLRFERANITQSLLRSKVIKHLTYPERFTERPYDIAFLGALNARRASALAALAPTLASHDCFLHAPRLDGPVRSTDPDMMSSSDFAQIAKNAKILLNIHQGESHYFEWHRLFLSGIAQGCVVVTEPCTPIGILQDGLHYLTATLADMPALIDHLLTTAEGRDKIQAIHDNGLRLMEEIESQIGLSASW